MELTNNEKKIMRIFWSANIPLSRRDIFLLNNDQDWNEQTLHSLLNSLVLKGAIREAGQIKKGKTKSRLYEVQYEFEQFCTELLMPVVDIISWEKVLEQIIIRHNISLNTVDEILNLFLQNEKCKNNIIE